MPLQIPSMSQNKDIRIYDGFYIETKALLAALSFMINFPSKGRPPTITVLLKNILIAVGREKTTGVLKTPYLR